MNWNQYIILHYSNKVTENGNRKNNHRDRGRETRDFERQFEIQGQFIWFNELNTTITHHHQSTTYYHSFQLYIVDGIIRIHLEITERRRPEINAHHPIVLILS